MSFARQNGIELLFGDPDEEVAGRNIVFPADPALLKARDLDLNELRRKFIRRAVKGLDRALSEAELRFLAEETRSDVDFVKSALQ